MEECLLRYIGHKEGFGACNHCYCLHCHSSSSKTCSEPHVCQMVRGYCTESKMETASN